MEVRMADFDPLDPSIVCHPILPANVPIDQVRYSTILPVETLVGSTAVPAEIPAAWLMPTLLGNVKAASETHLRKLHQAATTEGTVVKAWNKVDLTTETNAASVKIGSLGEVLSRGKVKMEGGDRSLRLDAGAITSLSHGRPALVRLDDGSEVVLQPDFALADGHYFVALDAAGRADVLASSEVAVARVGRKAVALEGKDIDAFLRTGQTTVRFVDNDAATLTLLLHEDATVSPRAQFLREMMPGEPPIVEDGMPVNLADRFALRMARANLAVAGGDDTEIETGSGRGIRPRGTVGAPPPPPPPGTGYTSVPPPEPPSVSLPRFPLVFYVPYRQDWMLKGYARGALLNTISMGPLEECTIEVFSWERNRRENETTTGSESENSMEGSINNKVTLDVVDESRRENGWKLDVGVDVSYPGSPVGGHVGLDLKDELTKNTKNATQNINDATLKAANKIKATRQTKVIETSEFGSETKVVRRLKNPNTGRTLNLDAFEVVAHYTVVTQLERSGVRLAALAEMYDFLTPMLTKGPGQKEALLSFEHVIAPLVPTNLKPGFAAARVMLAAERICAFKCAAACTCEDKGGTGPDMPPEKVLSREQQLVAELPALTERVRDAINAIASAGYVTLGRTIKQHWDNLLNSDPNSRPSQAQWDAARQEAKRYLFRRFVMEGPATRFWAAARVFAASNRNESAAKLVVAARKVQGTDVLNTISVFVGLQARVVGEIAGMIGSGWPLVVPDLIGSGLGFEDAGLESALDALQSVVDELENLRKPPPAPAAQGGAGTTPEPIAAVVEKPEYEPKALAEASIDFDLLVRYLQNNANFFRAQLWKSIDAADRLRFLSVYGSLGSLTTGRILGFVGTSAILELDVSRYPELEKWFVTTIQENDGLNTASSSFDTILPTPAVTLEARLGACDALEPYLAESRSIELARTRSIADQQALEAKRRSMKLDAKELDDPQPRPPLLVMERPAP
jgi:hypothetical protein